MDFPKISIITPNYNGGRFLEATICSLIAQQYPNLEYIIVDGGSTDDSLDIINKYRSHFAHVVVEKDNGMYDAINKGMRLSTGEIMGWLNADDMHHPRSLFTLAEIFGRFSEVNWLMGNPTYFDESGRTIHCYGIYRICRYDYMVHQGGWLQQESTFWRRSLWDKAGGCLSTQYAFAADFELWSRFFQHDELFLTDTLLAGFRYRSSNQLTLEHFNDYVAEVNAIIDRQVRQFGSAKFRWYRRAQFVIRQLRRLRVINTSYFDLFLRARMGVANKIICFDRRAQQYSISG